MIKRIHYYDKDTGASSKGGFTSPMVAIGIMLTIKAIFFQVDTPLMELRFTVQKTHRQARGTVSMAV